MGDRTLRSMWQALRRRGAIFDERSQEYSDHSL
jgi:hypothetical protein